jgi:hypothetical protein
MPECTHPLHQRLSFYPTRYRSLYIPFPEWIRSDTEDPTPCSGMDPILSDPIIKLKPFFRNGSDPIRLDTGVYTPSDGMDPTRSDPVPELIHLLTEWIRCCPTRYRSLYIVYDTEPILSYLIPKLVHPLPEWIRSYPIRYQSLNSFFRNGSDAIPELIPLLPE